jgi:WD40 repeat protein/tRNA A-37 threonylcarbamoyl transferase component Bud32
MADRAGQLLGNYRLIRLLGKGGFAEVYLGEHLHLDTQAAIKLLSAQFDDDELEHFRNEARLIARLEHPHVVRVLDFGVAEGVPFLVMSYASNGTLRTRYSKGTRLSLHEIVSYTQQAASALQYAHNEKLIHRDVKPENMLLDKQGSILLSDFGLATIAQSSRTQTRRDIAGTVTYMAPEQLQGKPCPASDQYALGVVVYEWLCGNAPFHGYGYEAATQHILTPPPSLCEKLPTLPKSIELVVMRALEKDPHKRFASVQEFASVLEQIYKAEGLSLTEIDAALEEEQTTGAPEPTQYLKTLIHVKTEAKTEATTPLPVITRTSSTSFAAGTTYAIYHGHQTVVTSVAWSPDSKRLASAGHDQTVQIWAVFPTEQPSQDTVLIYHGHTGLISVVTWSHDGKRVASGSWDMSVQTWETHMGKKLLNYRNHTKSVTTVAWSPDDQRIASCGYDQSVQIWSAATGQHLLTYKHPAAVAALAWSPNGKHIASGGYDQSTQVWDASTGNKLSTYHGHSGAIQAIAWSSNGKRIATGSRDGMVHIWDDSKQMSKLLAKGKALIYRGHTGPVYALTWSPNGKYIASGGKDGSVHVWDSTTGNTLFTYHHHTASVTSVAWSPDGRYVASAGEDKTVHIWFAPTL